MMRRTSFHIDEMNLLQTIKRFGCVALLVAGVPTAWGYSWEGAIGNKDDAWQVPAIGYGWDDPVAPKNFYEEYRPVVQVFYYASDASFATYYGAYGMSNVDLAFGLLNGVMCGQTNTPVFLFSPTNGVTMNYNGLSGGVPLTIGAGLGLDNYSANLTEFPLEARQINYTARALGLWDLRSTVLHLMVLQLGLANPDRYVWTLHDRVPNMFNAPKPTCPGDVGYLVVQRNFDVNPTVNYPYSPFINGSLFTYSINENCGQDPTVPWSAITEPSPADPFGSESSAVASGGLYESFPDQGSLQQTGWFYRGLTRDDAAGFKNLLSTNTINWEATAPSGGQLVVSNLGPVIQLTTSNLYSLLITAQTNAPATLSGLFPDVVVANCVTNYGLVTNWNIGSYVTNLTGATYDTLNVVVYSNIIGTAFQPVYQDAFANVITNGNLAHFPGIVLTGTNVVLNYSSNTVFTVQTVQVAPLIGAPYGSPPITNTTYQTIVLTNQPSGEYFVLPPGQCGWKILNDTPAWSVVAVTNLVTLVTNTFSTSSTNGTSTNTYVGSQSIVYYFTNHTYLAQAINCSTVAAAPALRRGLGRVEFIRVNYDSLLGQVIDQLPLTNYYSMTVISNNQPVLENYERVVTAPDILIQAQDLVVPNPPAKPYGPAYTVSTPNFDQSAIFTQLAGPGAIIPGTTIVFNEGLNNLFVNGSLNALGLPTNNFVLGQDQQSQVNAFGSYDGSTNYPVVYPSTASIATLMNQMIVQATPAPPNLPDGTNGAPYNGGAGLKFTATGGQLPYQSWVANGGLAGTGLSFNGATQILSGTPAAAPGTYYFTIQLTDSANQVINLNYSLTIH